MSGAVLLLPVAGCYNEGSFLLLLGEFPPACLPVCGGFFLPMRFLFLRGRVHFAGAFLYGKCVGKGWRPNHPRLSFPDRNACWVVCRDRHLTNRLREAHYQQAMHCIHAIDF